MFDPLTPADYAGLLADIWEDRGWDVDVDDRGDGTYLVAGDRESGDRGLILVRPGAATVEESDLQEFVDLCEQKGVGVRVAATRGGFSDGAEQLAAANDVHLLDPDALQATVHEEGLEHLVEARTPGGSSDDGGRLPSLPGVSSPPIPGGTAQVAVGVLLVLATFGAGVMASGVLLEGSGGAMLPGGGGDFPVSAVSTANADETADFTVRWNAVERSSVDLNGSTYEAPDGKTYVLVQLDVTNRGEEARAIRPGRFVFAANGTVHANQQWTDAEYFPPTLLDPGESRERWTVFAVPEGATSGTLLVDQNAGSGPVAVKFSHDPSLALNVTATG